MALTGAEIIVKQGTKAILGIRATNIKRNGVPISDKDKDSGPHQIFVADKMSSASLSFDAEGIIKDATFRKGQLASNVKNYFLSNVSLQFSDGLKISGDFILQDYEEGHPYEGEATFKGAFISNGVWSTETVAT